MRWQIIFPNIKLVDRITDTLKKRLRQLNRRLNEEGMRVLTVAVKKDAHQEAIYDMAQLTIPWDSVDEEEIAKPVKWQVGGLLKFTLCIGPVSSVFDILTFLMMWYILGATTIANQAVFQTGWFVVGLVTQTLVVHIVRTKKVPFIQSRASFPVIIASLMAILVGILLVLSPMKEYFSFTDLPAKYWLGFICITITYLLPVEIAKRFYIRLTKEWL